VSSVVLLCSLYAETLRSVAISKETNPPLLGTEWNAMNAALSSITRRELDRRISAGLEITLFWDPRDDSTSIHLHRAATDQTISFRVPSGRALDAFHHPFAHLKNHHERDLEIDDLWRN
jgi:hypothetical protein